MRFQSVQALAAALVATATASPSHVVHEKRVKTPVGWTKREKVESRAILPLRIGLKQRNLDRAGELLDSVSNPASSKYAQHWSAKEVAEMFAPSDKSVTSVISWLTESGIDGTRIAVSAGKTWVTVNASVHEVESLIKAEYHIYEHESGQLHVGADSYSLPAELSAEHVDIVLPTLHFDAKLHPGRKGSGEELRKKRSTTSSVVPDIAKSIGKITGSLPKKGKQCPKSDIITVLEECDEQIVPDCLRALYSIPVGSSAEKGNSMGIVEYTPQSYLPQDLDLFFSNFSKKQVGDRPILDSIDGGVPLNTTDDINANVESDLDLEYAMTLVYPQTVTCMQSFHLLKGYGL
jgi:tripeptidyl-peptidase-1